MSAITALSAPLTVVLSRALEANPLETVICVGSAARHAVDVWPDSVGLHRVNMIHPAFPDTGQCSSTGTRRSPGNLGMPYFFMEFMEQPS